MWVTPPRFGTSTVGARSCAISTAATDDIPLIQPASSLRHGTKPELVRCLNLEEEQQTVADWFQKHQAAGVPWRGMAVLCRYNSQIQKMRDALRKLGIPATNADQKGDKTVADMDDAVQVLTMHASKGLEFHCVAIPDLGAMPSDKAPEADEARVLYVAMTRATEALLVTAHTESVFTNKLMGGGHAVPRPDSGHD